uniref:Cytochrome c oxidase subunit 2 n=1 Tax=Trichuris rhinopiptheroxella TaxID=2282176 RepID=A0A346HH48_9BILA|nr:cytochrome c oxidase subunit 2 [Trichuris rhinopiptheroxella]
MIKWNSPYLQDSINLTSLKTTTLCDWVMTMMLLVLIAVLWFFFSLVYCKTSTNTLIELKSIEMAWTSLPMLILALMASISMKTLYTEEPPTQTPAMNLLVTGHQWYWEYYYPDFGVNFESFLAQWENDNFRNIECDYRTILPLKTSLRIAVTSADVIHSWWLPPLGVKLDATPGRIISMIHNCNVPGLSFGFCAELCGVNHSYMPITVEHVPILLFKNWLLTTK